MIGVDIMYVCLECGHLFEEGEEKTVYETHGFSTPPYEEFRVCPRCSGPYTNAFRCDCCDDWITGDYIKTDDGQRYCDNCYYKMELGEED